jgi:N-acetylgalactosamine-N,N'-diacetylbacillosaminyl-diphospho-undecaprenol 4-alpha-N-acetylgalactosaminyltransferase
MKKKLSIVMYSMVGGGAERVVSVLLDELKEIYDVTLVMMRKKIDYSIPEEVKVVFLEDSNPDEHGIFKLLKLPLLAWKYKNFCNKNHINISMSFTTRPTYFSIFSKWLGNKSVIVVNESTTPSMMYKSKTLVSKINKFLIRFLYPHASVIIANSEGGKSDLIENFSIKSSKIKTIYNPCDLETIREKSKEKVNNIDFDRYTFVSAGRLDAGKNHAMLIRSFSKIKNKDAQLLILGEGYLKHELQSLIQKLSLEQRVFLLGFDANPYKYFSKADTFVFSSRYEGFPVVLIEALTCRLAMISTDCKSGPRELLSPKSEVGIHLKDSLEIAEFGILTPVDNEELLTEAMNCMMQKEDLAQEYRKKSQLRVESFNQHTIVPQFIDILNSQKS